MFGLTPSDIEAIVAVIRKEKSVQQALVFGSRAKGNYKPSSDIDIVLKGEHVNASIAAHIASELNDEGLLPYKFDVLAFSGIDNQNLIEHINRTGGIIFQSQT